MYLELLSDCDLCPRNCHVDRSRGQRGYCGATDQLLVARAALHCWEEPCISGTVGSGAVFFSCCALGCVYCQNRQIAQGLKGERITTQRLAEILLALQAQGAHNINLVTPTHYVPQIISALIMAREQGLVVPIVYNSSGYEKVETLRLLAGYIDVYLPDLKYMDPEPALRYSHAADYFAYAAPALAEMVRQTGGPVFDDQQLMIKGVIVRHLVLPGQLANAKATVKYLYETFGDRIYISIMNQYTPLSRLEAYPELKRKISQAEYDEVVDYALSLGVENGFIQEGDTASESFIPDFNGEGVRP